MDTPAVVLGLSGTGLSATRQLGRRGIRVEGVVWSRKDTGNGSRFCTTRLAPDASDAAEALVEYLLKLPVPDGTVLLPSSDEGVRFIQTWAEELQGRFSFYQFPKRLADLLTDKKAQYQLASAAGMSLPQTFYPSSVDEAAAIAETITYPAFIKAHFGHLWSKQFPGKGVEVQSAAEFTAAFAKIAKTGLEALVQSVIPGPVEGLVSVCCHRAGDGRILGVFTQRKLRQFPIDFGVGTLVESIREPELEHAVEILLEKLDYRGTAEVEFKWDDTDGQYKYIELNARVWQQHALAVRCGVDFAYLQYLELAGKPLITMKQTTTGLRWISLWEDLFAARALIRANRLTAASWLKSVAAVRSHNTFAIDDLMPAIKLYGGHLKGTLDNRFRRLV